MKQQQSAKRIIDSALKEYNPVHVLLMFSGGHDSLTSTHFAGCYLREIGVDFTVYHGDTTIGIRETQDFVKKICDLYGLPLAIRRAPDGHTYVDIVKEKGFPGPSAHRYMYIRLKERALLRYVNHEVKSSPYARENVLLITGIRKDESRIRMGYIHTTQKDGSRVWCNPIFNWSAKQCEDYRAENKLPRNPVKDRICISGECLCGAFASKEERAEIKACFPETEKELQRLEAIARDNGHPWPWGHGPNEWFDDHPPGLIDMFTGEVNPGPGGMYMCVGCEKKMPNPEPSPEVQERITLGLLRAELENLELVNQVLLSEETGGKTAKARNQAMKDREAILARMAQITKQLEYEPR